MWYIKRREQFSFSLEEKKIQRVSGMEWVRRKKVDARENATKATKATKSEEGGVALSKRRGEGGRTEEGYYSERKEKTTTDKKGMV